jgi:hypothetical protein
MKAITQEGERYVDSFINWPGVSAGSASWMMVSTIEKGKVSAPLNSRHKSDPETLFLPFRKDQGDNIGLSFFSFPGGRRRISFR